MSRFERGRERLAQEAERIEQIKRAAAVPDRCGDQVIASPARGPFVVTKTKALYPSGDDGFEVKGAGYKGFDTIGRLDAFAVMMQRAKAHKRPPPFTSTQIAIGRQYRDMKERHAGSGLRGSSLETVSGGGGGSGGYEDALLQEGRQIERLEARVGSGIAMVVRRVRPSKRGTRSGISDLMIVQDVCIRDMELSKVLKRYGWAVNAANMAAIRAALTASLDRMVGHQGGSRMVSHTFTDRGGAK